MTRLVHDFQSSLRSYQMSASDFFCFVEGTDADAYIYSEISNPLFLTSGHSHEFFPANSLTSDGKCGGKQILLNFFKYLKIEKCLSTTWKGKKTTFIFFLDKDIDDIDSSIIKSKHLIYTEYYDIQNYLFRFGNLIQASAAASSIPAVKVSASIGDVNVWLDTCIYHWKEWIAFCMHLKYHSINIKGYGRVSDINSTPYGPIDFAKFQTFKRLAIRKSGLKKSTYCYTFKQFEKKINTLIGLGKGDKVFKGKWYINWILDHLKASHGVSTTPAAITSALATSLDFNEEWSSYFSKKIQIAINVH